MKKMSTKISPAGDVLQLKITLNESVPRIWRRIVVPADYTFFDLHCAIQDAMGWTDSHLHAFHVMPPKRKARDMITIQFPNPDFDDWQLPGEEALDERKERITGYLGSVVKQCTYSYDFGDGWDHTVLLERVLPRDLKAQYPQCIGGENACPPEDCGGVGGYESLQQILKDPKHEEHDSMVEWLGLDDVGEFDPHTFDPADIEFLNPKKRLKEYEKGFGLH